tara:strand:- start:340 stop:480 length:141 start_codon:yes stop_codon:yes gene_type:complete
MNKNAIKKALYFIEVEPKALIRILEQYNKPMHARKVRNINMGSLNI